MSTLFSVSFCEQHTSHVTFSQCCTTDLHAHWVSLACALHVSCVIFMSSCSVFDSLRLLHFPPFAVHLLSYHPVLPHVMSFLLAINFIFHDVMDKIPCALQLMRTLAPLPSTTLSQVTEATEPYIQESSVENGSRMTSSTMISLSARRSLHHCSPRSEKMMRAVGEPITIKTNVCRPVSRRPSVIIQR